METKKEVFRIRKIDNENGWWILYPRERKEPVYLKADMVIDKLPPKWKFPWQSHELRLTSVGNAFISHAEMDGQVILHISSEDYPDEIKKQIEDSHRAEVIKSSTNTEYLNTIRRQLLAYLPKLPEVSELEAKVNALALCWRKFMQPLLPKLRQNAEQRSRVMLMYYLVDIANSIYQRDIKSNEVMDVVFSSAKFMTFNLYVDQCDTRYMDYLERNPGLIEHDAYALYREVDAKSQIVLPKPEFLRLNLYLNMVICKLLEAYAHDYSRLICMRPRDLFGDTIDNDEENYPRLQTAMQLPKFTSLVIE